MNAPLKRLYAAQQATFDDRRREPRHATRFEAILETSQGRRLPVQLADISLHGCSVRAEGDGLRQGAFVSIGLCDDSMLSAVVRWVRGDAAGMEFLRAVPANQTAWHDLMDFGLDG